ncbi:MAG: hypothetical protein U1E81_05955 [Xanthobacteraceae bacterium]
MTGMPRFSAVPISMRTKSSGLSKRRVPFLVTRFEPARTNDRKQRIALGDFLVDRFDEVGAKRDGVDVHE